MHTLVDFTNMNVKETLILAKNAQSLKISNFINGLFVDTDRYIDSIDPSTGHNWALIPDSDNVNVNEAVISAENAFKNWSQTSTQYRSRILQKISDIIEENIDIFAEIESRDQGKPISLAKSIDIPRCVLNFRFFASAILHDINDSIIQREPVPALNYVVKQPIGVAGLICPWNLPLYLLSFKLAPALATGNTVVAKPSEFTSVTAWLLAHVLKQAGLPPGVVNFVFGTGPKVGDPLVRHTNVPLISFTGSTKVGGKIAEIAAVHGKKVSLEMGGKNPCLVFKSVDLDEAISSIVKSCFANQGEICLCTSRLFVEEEIFAEFCCRFAKLADNLKVNDPRKNDTDMGAVVSHEHFQKITKFIQSAEQLGARLICGQKLIDLDDRCKNGYFIRPIAVTDISDDSALMQEEIFGPVVCIVPFNSESEAISRANNVPYGLSASVWSRDVNQVHRVAHRLQVGTVWCNCWLIRELNMPFGGMKASGRGRESAKDSVDFFTEKKTICLKLQ